MDGGSTVALHHTLVGEVVTATTNVFSIVGFGLLTWWAIHGGAEAGEGEDEEDENDMRHAVPVPPEFLKGTYTQKINIAVCGLPGVGKSCLINGLRRVGASEPDAAPVGLKAEAADPAGYSFPFEGSFQPHARSTTRRQSVIWDIPGIGTDGYPAESYIIDAGLCYVDVVIIVYSGRLSEADLQLSEGLKDRAVPRLLVRTQVDCDVTNEAQDYGRDEEEVLANLRAEVAADVPDCQVFCVSGRSPTMYDMQSLRTTVQSMARARERASHTKDCPVCFDCFDSEEHTACVCNWCNNYICKRCARVLCGKRKNETPCPFCRRWSVFMEVPPSSRTTSYTATPKSTPCQTPNSPRSARSDAEPASARERAADACMRYAQNTFG